MLTWPSVELILNLRSTRLRSATWSSGRGCHAEKSSGNWGCLAPWVTQISAQVPMQLSASSNGCGCW
eukprot:3180242-Pyramimonas_sp.AAC.1